MYGMYIYEIVYVYRYNLIYIMFAIELLVRNNKQYCMIPGDTDPSGMRRDDTLPRKPGIA